MLSFLLTNWVTSIIFIALIYVGLRHGKFAWITLWNLKRDLRLTYHLAVISLQLKLMERNNSTVGKLFEKVVRINPNKVCFAAGDQEWSFQEVDNLGNKLANYFSAQGYQKGDVVALLMDNRPEYICVWLGLSKIGVVTALINFNLRSDSLRHCVQVADAKSLIYVDKFSQAVKEVMDEGGFKDIELYNFDITSTTFISRAKNLQVELKSVSNSAPTSKSSIGFLDKLCYVYTSGTTGLPKAAVIKHSRFIMAGVILHHLSGFEYKDVLVTPLPLYHAAGGLIAVSQAIIYGTTIAILEKFSASRFWNDCIKHKATASMYLGELCRFLLAQPKRPEETQHQLRIMFGSGLRAEIWDEFVSRFKVPNVIENYGSTEGNCGLSNFIGYPGACGFVPRILVPILPFGLMRVDERTGELLRDSKTGLAIPCKPNEIGEMMGAINKDNPLRDFPGYTDSTSSNKKIMHNIFKDRDSCFRTGDLMVMDDYGYFYFRDRTGDTFRWKAENVSTMEVEAVLNRYCDMNDVAVFGVQIPATDGRAGMAVIADPNSNLDWNKLEAGIIKSLPSYARPVFIRILSTNINLTGTYKLQKVDLQKEAIDISVIKDKIYIAQNGKYIPLTKEIHEKVMSGKLRL